jgi:large exoprotein involved in heme utilization and adhesion
VVINNSEFGTNVFRGVEDSSGGIRIKAENIEVKNFSQINSVGYGGVPASIGDSGNIEFTANNSLLMENGALIRAGTGGSGKGGDIVVRTGSLTVRDGSVFYSPVFGGTGNGGDVDIDAESIHFSNAKYPGYLTGVSTQIHWPGTGKGGDVRINTESLEMLAGTQISTPTFSSGQGGNITVTVNGHVSIEGTRQLTPGGSTIYTGLFANTFSGADGGNIELTANNLQLTTEAGLQVRTFWTGNAGDATVRVGSLEMSDASYITTSAAGSEGGSAGNLEVIADNIFISGPESSADPFDADFTGLTSSSSYNAGSGGNMRITTDSLTLTNRAQITSSSNGPDLGGNMEIYVGSFQVLNGSAVLSSGLGSGPGGNVVVVADSVLVSGVHPEPFTDATGTLALAPSGIASQSANLPAGAGAAAKRAGDVVITTNSLELWDGGRLSVETFDSGHAGNIHVDADNVIISGVNSDLRDFQIAHGRDPRSAHSGIFADTGGRRLGNAATGNGGNIEITAQNVQLSDQGLITSATETPGDGGIIALTADNVSLSGGASIAAESRLAFATITGNAGDISITANQTLSSHNSSITTAADEAEGGDIAISAPRVEFFNNTSVRAETFGVGDAGNILITAPVDFYMNHSSVTTEAVQADGGNIKIDADGMVYIVDSEITASVGGGPNTVGGNVSIDPEYVILKNSNVIAQAFEGRGGNITIIADLFLQDEYSEVSASSAKGVHGTVDIRAPIKDISQQVKPLSKTFTSASEMLREACIARIRGGEYSSFIVGGRDGLPLEPGPRGLLPSPLPLQ